MLATLMPLASSAAKAPRAACTRPALVLLDASGSMATQEAGRSRIGEAEEALARVVPPQSMLRPIGLLIYSGSFTRCDDIRFVVPPALDSGPAIVAAIAGTKPSGATPIGAAVQVAATYFTGRNEDATLIVVTDGQENCGADLCRLADDLAAGQTRFTVHIIGYGVGPEQAAAMRCLADRNEGRYFDAGTGAALLVALEEALKCPAISRAPERRWWVPQARLG